MNIVYCLWPEMKPSFLERYNHSISESVKEMTDLQYMVFISIIFLLYFKSIHSITMKNLQMWQKAANGSLSIVCTICIVTPFQSFQTDRGTQTDHSSLLSQIKMHASSNTTSLKINKRFNSSPDSNVLDTWFRELLKLLSRIRLRPLLNRFILQPILNKKKAKDCKATFVQPRDLRV